MSGDPIPDIDLTGCEPMYVNFIDTVTRTGGSLRIRSAQDTNSLKEVAPLSDTLTSCSTDLRDDELLGEAVSLKRILVNMVT